ALEDLAAIGALALEHCARIMQPMGADMERGIAPGHELAVVPDDSVEPVVGFLRHRASSVAPVSAVPRPEFSEFIKSADRFCVAARHPVCCIWPIRARLQGWRNAGRK